MSKVLRNILIIMLLLSTRLAAQTTYYVTFQDKDGNAMPVGLNGGWTDVTTLADAINKAKAGDQIWIQGSDKFEEKVKMPETEEYTLKYLYKVPKTGFTVKSGVNIYGGFVGTETRIEQREYIDGNHHKLKYRTLLSGDTNNDDNVKDMHFIFPTTDDPNNRDDNARHVLILDMNPASGSNNNTLPTIINGLCIARGHANGTQGTEDSHGAGILVKGDNTNGGYFRIESCFFMTNYAWQGGAIYVGKDVKHHANHNTILDCAFCNNAAGSRTKPSNNGAGIYTVGDVDIANSLIYNNSNGGICGVEAASGDNGINVFNSTIARNSGSGIDGTSVDAYNTVVWGNTYIYSTQQPSFYNCAYAGASGNSNLALNPKNAAADGPLFVSPSLTTGYDSKFDIMEKQYPEWIWELQGESPLIDRGSKNLHAPGYGSGTKDLKGNPRLSGDNIDIGAFEFQALSHIRYVRKGGTGDGSSWANASGNLQNMIDALAATGGEVWVAAGTYSPSAYLLSGKEYTVSFCMRNNVSVYGGFAGTEISKDERVRKANGKPWDFVNETILQGQGYATPASWGAITSSTRHVVWFAPLSEGEDFEEATYLDGVTVMGGSAPGGNGVDDFLTDRGAGIYMKGRHAQVINCIIKNNYAKGPGAGIYIEGLICEGNHGGGLVQRSLIFNNVSEDNGGGVYIGGSGLVRRCVITNNKGRKGSAVYLTAVSNGVDHNPTYNQLSTCVISNNTSGHNGAVYCDKSGVLVHNTIVNNRCVKSTDTADGDAAQTGGLYIDSYALLINNVLWNNRFGKEEDISTVLDIPLYVKNPSTDNVQFHYNAISGASNAVWNSTLQEETMVLYSKNCYEQGDGIEYMYPDFTGTDAIFDKVGHDETNFGDLTKWTPHYWAPDKGSALWSAGLEQGLFSDAVLIAAELDISGELFSSKPSIGANRTEEFIPVHAEESDRYVLYVSPERTSKDCDGSSWDKPFRSINKALDYFARLTSVPADIECLEVRVMEGNLWPRYTFVNEDPRSATINFPKAASGKTIRLVGGYYRKADNSVERAPMIHRSILEGNRKGANIEEGSYHLVTVEAEAKAELDGLYIVNGYAYGSASIQHGAGVLAHAGSEVTILNSIFEDNTAASSAAVYGDANTKVTMRNCVVNNNTNKTEADAVVYAPTLTLEHVSFINNDGAAPALTSTCFALNNSSGNSDFDNQIKTIGVEGAKNFANPSNDKGAKLGFDTYLGGYAVYRPLTSSVAASTYIINKVSSGTSSDNVYDITAINDRDLGGVSDLGAYEAELPKKGRVYYVCMPENGGSDSNNGLSWNKAFATVRKAVATASAGTVEKGEKPQVWVAAGTYSQEPESGSNNCFEILDGVNVYGAFPKTGSPSMNDRHPFISNYIYHDSTYIAVDYETILQPSGTSSTRRVLGQADIYNPYDNTTETKSYEYVGVDNGNYEYADEDKYVESVGGEYYYSATGGEYVKAETHLCDYLEWTEETGYYKYYNSGTSCRASSGNTYKNLVQVGSGYGNYTVNSRNRYTDVGYGNGDYTDFTSAKYYRTASSISGSNYFEKGTFNSVNSGTGTHIKTDAEYNYVGKGYGNYTLSVKAGSYYEVGTGKGSYVIRSNKKFSYYTRWDGFTLQNGYLDSSKIKYLGDNGKRNGGAGAAFFTNVTLANCIIYKNENTSSNTGDELRGGGFYIDGGVMENCYVLQNKFGQTSQYTAYGGGGYLFEGTVYNCVISENKSYGQYTDGAGLFIEGGAFYNNTVIKNESHGTERGNGGIAIWKGEGGKQLLVYNTIAVGNTCNVLNLTGSKDFASNGGPLICRYSISEDVTNKTGSGSARVTFIECKSVTDNKSLFEDYDKGNYRLDSISIALNMGRALIEDDGKNVLADLSLYTDMDFTERIKDCTIDAGAYERNNQDNVKPDITTESGKAIYYVTQNGAGTANGDSPKNAACAMKLQEVLNAAGDYVADNTGMEVIVKVAGYEGGSFIYHVNTLADKNKPQSYSYSIPYGVTVMGGYNEGTYNDGVPDEKTYNWNDDKRDITKYRTIFSGIKQATSTTQEVHGYHTVTFKGIPETWRAGDKQTIIDGVYIQDGSATSLAGGDNDDTNGGAAIVTAGAHVRNCVIQGNEAKQGGGLYVMSGGVVSGCLIRNNTAKEEGGGVFADVDKATGKHAYLISNTIVENTAAQGGGVYINDRDKDDAAMVLNSVIWGNKANSDQNISAIDINKYDDTVLDAMTGNTNKPQKWHPFNHCYVETIELPGNLQNTKMESDYEIYFAKTNDKENYELKRYSPLIDHGMKASMQEYLMGATSNMNVSQYDIFGNNRLEVKDRFLDVGAFAYYEEVETKILRRIFVSPNSNYVVKNANDAKQYIGKTFYTPYTWLGDALEYIRKVRENNNKAKDIEFEIFMSTGFYAPKYRREDANTIEMDLRQNSFIIPYGVKIYGGFKGDGDDAKYISNVDGESITSIEFTSGTVGFTPLTDNNVGTLIASRKGSDFNDNHVKEAWEMAEQTILSGNVNTTDADGNNLYAYHVVYSDRDTYNGTMGVLLDGVTIQDGKTYNILNEENEVGNGGGIYSNGIDYTLVNCRLLNNQAIRGGGAFMRDANLKLINCMIAGNKAYTDSVLTNGGGVCVSCSKNITGKSSLMAVNTLWANNESERAGGAIGANGDAMINVMNNTFVRNKAVNDAVLYHTNNSKGNNVLVNTVMWGNNSIDATTTNVSMTYSASDRDYTNGTLLFGPDNGHNNIFLSEDNMALDGPRFTEPSTVAGLAGYSLNSKWNPVAVSPLTDHGNGKLDPTGKTEVGNEQAYNRWFDTNASDYAGKYMLTETYKRYSGPTDENGNPDNKPIDIGVHEYQYWMDFSTMDRIYVATKSSGIGDGSNWQNATDDLRGALIGAANPVSKEDNSFDGTKRVFVKSGDYPWPVPTSGHSIFPLYLGGNLEWNGIEIKGSCTGSGDEQDFRKPTVLKRHPYVPMGEETDYLMEISSSHEYPKSVTITGITFRNNLHKGDIKDEDENEDKLKNADKCGVNVLSNNGTITMKNVAFSNNPMYGMNVEANGGKLLLVNALFADNGGMGLKVDANLGNTVLVNTTFANNTADMNEGILNVYNSTAWHNPTQNMPTTEGEKDDSKNNKVFGWVEDYGDNDDIENGPNFYDPNNVVIEKRDYRIRPSMTLLNKGNNVLYLEHALGKTEVTEGERIPDSEKELYNELRQVGDHVDIGAYEYRADLRRIIYVKEGVVNDRLDGSSWDRAIDNLQNAANLAGIYADQMKQPAYVFVHNKLVQRVPLDVNLDSIKIYGGMNDEVTSATKTEDIVKSLLNQREGLLEAKNRSVLTKGLTISGNSVVDGFEFAEDISPKINKGILATSIVNANVTGNNDETGKYKGILYNSLVKGNVTGVRTVNVTATGMIEPVDGNGNNRVSVTADNRYVTDDNLNYQLNEESVDIDAADTKDIQDFITMVGHNRDILGNKRIRNSVDNGCFETWNITKAMEVDDDTKTDKDCIVREDDYPHGKSVVYVRNDANIYGAEGAELLITKSYISTTPFNPGFLLLEHRAGLRANNNAVALSNFAVGRILDGKGNDMAVMPFDVTRTEGSAKLNRYDAATRAGYDYKFSATDGAWDKDVSYIKPTGAPVTTGWMLDGTAGSKMRFYGDSYVENVDAGKNIELVKNNFNDAWSKPNNAGNKFTHKENMSWNLFGSPYLCAMNYSDMQYGRVMYYYHDGAYRTINIIDNSDKGYIPAGDAVFAQTATLKTSETFTVEKPAVRNEKTGTAYQKGSNELAVVISRVGNTRAAGSDYAYDQLQLKAVPAEESHNDFDINSDGVKWMSADSIPQIYAVMNGGRYSLLSAVNVEGEVSVGVSLPEAGVYTFSVPEDCNVEDYETVVLKDNETGKLVDLFEGEYDFSVLDDGDIQNRFSISFNRMLDGKTNNGISIWCPKCNVVSVEGADSGDIITVYNVSGNIITRIVASSSSETISVPMQGVVIVEVQHEGISIVKKVWSTK